jgi:hypothetical protein
LPQPLDVQPRLRWHRLRGEEKARELQQVEVSLS